MKTFLRLSALCAFGIALTAPASAAFESIKLNPDNPMPLFPLTLQVAGITRGEAVIDVSVNADGKLTEWLVLGYTNEQFVDACADVLKEWQFTPAKLDGVPVPARSVFTFNFSLEGAVISANIVNHFLFDNIKGMGDGYFVNLVSNAREIDRVPALVKTVVPKYATEAEKQGVRGQVKVHFYIDSTGAVRMPAVDAGAHPYLAETAVSALREWRFEPPTRYGRPVLIAASQVFDFGKRN